MFRGLVGFGTARKAHVPQDLCRAGHRHTDAVVCFELVGVAHALVAVNGEQRPRGIVRVLDRIEECAIGKFGEADCLRVGAGKDGNTVGEVIRKDGISRAASSSLTVWSDGRG